MQQSDVLRPLPELLRGHAHRIGDKTAFCDARRGVTYADLERRTGRLAGHLVTPVGPGAAPGAEPGAGCGLRRGGRVAVYLDDCVEVMESCLAAVRAGAIAVPLNPRASDTELDHLLRDSAAAVVVTDPAHLEQVLRVAPGAGGPSVLVIGDEAPPSPSMSFEALATTEPACPAPDDLPLDDPAWMLYTSGTSGRPKGVLSTQRNRLWSVAACFTGILGLDERDRLLWPLPLSHSFSHVLCLHGVVATGASARILGGFDPCDVLAALRDEPFTVLAGVPAMYHQLVRAAGPDGFGPDPARPRLCLCAGGVATEALCAAFEGTFGMPLIGGYGCTETSGPVAMNRLSGRRAPGSAGPPVPGVAVRLVDPATGRDAGVGGGEGEVWVRGPGVMTGYHDRPAETERRLRDGWYRTGDLGRTDEHGFLTIGGRIGDLIRRGGESIAPAEVEEVLRTVPGVADAAVAAQPHEILGEVPVAFLVPDPGGLDAARIFAACRDRLSYFKVPDALYRVEEIPRSDFGKIERKALLDSPAPLLAVSPGHGGSAAPPSARRTRPDLSTPYVPPESETEKSIAALWAGLLGVDRVGVTDDFLELGGNSLLAARCTAKLAGLFGSAPPSGTMYAAPTVRKVAALIDAGRPSAAPTPAAPVRPPDHSRPLPLAPAQTVFWYIDHYRRPGGARHPDFALSLQYRITGRLDTAALATAVDRLIERNEALRTRVLLGASDGHQIVLDRVADAFVHHSAGGSAGSPARPLDPEAGRVLAVELTSASPIEHLLVIRAHHLVADASSMTVIAGELAELYNAAVGGRAAALGPPSGYGDLMRRTDETFFAGTGWRRAEPHRSALRYWTRQAAHASPIRLTDRRPAPGSRPTMSATVLLTAEETAALTGLARRNRASVFAVLLAALARLLALDTGDRDVRLLTLNAARETPEADRMVGLLLNPVLLRVDAPPGRTFTDAVASTAGVVRDALTHGQVPVLALCEEIPDLLTVMVESQFVVFETLPAVPPLDLDGCAAQRLDPDGDHPDGGHPDGSNPDGGGRVRQRFPVDLLLTARPEGDAGDALRLAAKYDPEVFPQARIDSLLDRFRRLVTAGCRHPESSMDRWLDEAPEGTDKCWS
ncbi:AMP-binding protein [Actinomadura sp. 1N219]|uniref:AMP-binding protein n=1 Tax=Actinomadura sp. 1N219 TaxID=3375152 RepID=UPI00378D22BA